MPVFDVAAERHHAFRTSEEEQRFIPHFIEPTQKIIDYTKTSKQLHPAWLQTSADIMYR
jgi:hypothetical protein